ncbi:DUF3108 domain-containing protein [Falsiroseomonas sp. CW058]|uniref:DUF3108 domain-containing protein n=1 Tax=Falsiroseomonas sp. CW058 TaxID=3388664 RepID=UPI003D30F0AE
MRTGPILLPILALLAAPAAAQQPVVATYEVYAAGMTVLQLEARFDVSEAGYRIRTQLRTRGIAAVFAPGEQATQVEGGWAGAAAAPRSYLTEGTFRGRYRRIALAWQGGAPQVLELTPPETDEREPVPAALQRNTMDALSAMAQLARLVDRSGGCDGAVPVFDGRRRSDYASRTERRELIRPWRGAWSGEALRCAFEGRLVAGFRHDQDRAASAAPQTGTAWIAAPFPGAPPIPVRLEIPNRWVGHATAVLLRAEPSAALAQPVQQRR